MNRILFIAALAASLASFGCENGGGQDGDGGSGGSAGTGGQGGTGGSGGAMAECDPLVQDCEGGEGCYVSLTSGEQTCATPFEPGTQGDPCEFINNCDVGYGCNLLESPNSQVRVCAFFCDPEGGSPTCAEGPGPMYECRRINEFWADVPNVSSALGMCLDPVVFPAP